MRNIGFSLMLTIGLSVTTAAQAPRPPAQQELSKSSDGQELFKFYCANCHGMDARGRPATPAMRSPSTDLTMLAARNGGVFPRERVIAVIKHGSPATPAHGPKNMPVWGAIFRSMEPSDTLVEIRIENLVQYLESLQQSRTRLGDE
jgi:mono/diheme cytochrome c family protein